MNKPRIFLHFKLESFHVFVTIIYFCSQNSNTSQPHHQMSLYHVHNWTYSRAYTHQPKREWKNLRRKRGRENSCADTLVLRDGRWQRETVCVCVFVLKTFLYMYLIVVLSIWTTRCEYVRTRIHKHAYTQRDTNRQSESKNKKNKTIPCLTISVKSVFLIVTELSCVFYLLKRHLQTYREKKCECDCERKTERERKKEWMNEENRRNEI